MSLRNLITDVAGVLAAQTAAGAVHGSDALRRYVVAILEATRADPRVELGASPRAGLMLFRAAKAYAALDGRDHALPDDVQKLAAFFPERDGRYRACHKSLSDWLCGRAGHSSTTSRKLTTAPAMTSSRVLPVTFSSRMTARPARHRIQTRLIGSSTRQPSRMNWS